MAWHRANADSRRLAKIPGVGPIGAATAGDEDARSGGVPSGRQFAAWLGLTPKDHSTAGKPRLGVITRAGDEGLRSVLVVGATAVIQQVRRGRGRPSPWLVDSAERKPPKLAAVALANKMARIAWKLMVTGERYDSARMRPGIGAAPLRDRPAGEFDLHRLEPELARRADGVIDRSKTQDTPWDPVAVQRSLACLELASRKPSWPAFMCDRNNRPDIWTQAIRSDCSKHSWHGGRPHMGPGLRRDDVGRVCVRDLAA